MWVDVTISISRYIEYFAALLKSASLLVDNTLDSRRKLANFVFHHAAVPRLKSVPGSESKEREKFEKHKRFGSL